MKWSVVHWYCTAVTHVKNDFCQQVPHDFEPTEAERKLYREFECDDNCLNCEDIPEKLILYIRRTVLNFRYRERHIFLLARLQRDLPLAKVEKYHMDYRITADVKVCSKAFHFVFGVSETQMKSIRERLYQYGMSV